METRHGVWRLRVFVGNDPVSGHPRQRSRTVRGTARQADLALAAFVAEVANGHVIISSRQTVGEALDAWITFITPQRQPGTIRGYGDKIRRLQAALGNVMLDKLTAQELDRAYAKWLAEGVSPTTVRHCHRVLSACLHQAQRWGVLAKVVTDMARPPRAAKVEAPVVDPVVWLGLIEQTSSTEPALSMAITLAGVTGARRGELCGLRWSDVNPALQCLVISRAVKHGLDKRKLVLAPTKSHQTRRLSVDDKVLSLLDRYHELVAHRAAEAKTSVDPEGYILSLDPTCRTPMRPDTISAAFRRVTKQAGVNLRFHDLRHMNASLLIAGRTDIRTTAGRLGHADASTTLRIYSHMVEAQDRQAAVLLGNLLPPARTA